MIFGMIKLRLKNNNKMMWLSSYHQKLKIAIFAFIVLFYKGLLAQVFISDTSKVLEYKFYSHNLIVIDPVKSHLEDGNYVLFSASDSTEIRVMFTIKLSKLDGFYIMYDLIGRILKIASFNVGIRKSAFFVIYSNDGSSVHIPLE